MAKETRSLAETPTVKRSSDTVTARGYAALFNSPTEIAGAFTEELAPSVFSERLSREDVRALIDHDSGRVIGRMSAGTLRVSEDEKGLAVEIDLPDTTDGRDLAVSLERGDISGMSFAMKVEEEEWDDRGDIPHRKILRASIYEVSAVAFPAYPDTEIGLRSYEKAAEKQQKRQNFEAAAKRRRLKQDLASRVLYRPK